jgi:septum formation protein
MNSTDPAPRERPARPLVLASTSRYRRELLERLGLPFAAVAPQADETPLPGEIPAATALRLAEVKARSVAGAWPDALIIGSDQVADAGGSVVGKPGARAAAQRQLALLSGPASSSTPGWRCSTRRAAPARRR